jgi:hypothetical protein
MGICPSKYGHCKALWPIRQDNPEGRTLREDPSMQGNTTGRQPGIGVPRASGMRPVPRARSHFILPDGDAVRPPLMLACVDGELIVAPAELCRAAATYAAEQVYQSLVRRQAASPVTEARPAARRERNRPRHLRLAAGES